MEGAERAINAYAYERYRSKLFAKLFDKCKKQNELEDEKRFRGSLWLALKRAIPPELIIWENVGISLRSRFKKMVQVGLSLAVIFIMLFVILFILESQGQIAEDKVSTDDCPTNTTISMEDALSDYILAEEEREGLR